jgi:hypothetical protein
MRHLAVRTHYSIATRDRCRVQAQVFDKTLSPRSRPAMPATSEAAVGAIGASATRAAHKLPLETAAADSNSTHADTVDVYKDTGCSSRSASDTGDGGIEIVLHRGRLHPQAFKVKALSLSSALSLLLSLSR